MVSKLLLFAFLVVFMAGWSYLLCYLDSECQPFEGDFFFFPDEGYVSGGSSSSDNNNSSSSSSLEETDGVKIEPAAGA